MSIQRGLNSELTELLVDALQIRMLSPESAGNQCRINGIFEVKFIVSLREMTEYGAIYKLCKVTETPIS